MSPSPAVGSADIIRLLEEWPWDSTNGGSEGIELLKIRVHASAVPELAGLR